MNRSRCQEIFEKVRQASDADGVEATITGGTHFLTRFANNTIHQNVAEEGYMLSVRTIYGRRTARATTNKFDDESIRRVAADSAAVARQQQPDPELLDLAGPEESRAAGGAPERLFSATAALDPESRARSVGAAVAIAERGGFTAAGIYGSGSSMQAVLNSRGLFAWHEESHSEFSITVLAGDSSGWAKANSPDHTQMAPEQLAERAAAKAALSAKPAELPPGRYTVILEPAAVLDLLGFMFYDFSGRSVHDKRSFLTGRMGATLFGPNITITDDAYHPLQSGAPFDGEGAGRQQVKLVDAGRIAALVYSRQTAQIMAAAPTGHGFPLPNEFGEAPMNIVIAGGESSVEQMIASTGHGVVVTRLWYIREVDPYQKILTGMTRDGTFAVENGRIARGLLNFRFNVSLIEMLSKVDMLSPAVRTAGEESFEMVVPAMKVREFNFTEVTRF